MRYYSTKNKKQFVSFKEAVIKGLPDDNGLYMPESIPTLSSDFFSTLRDKSLSEIAYTVAKPFVGNTLSDDTLKNIVEETFDFPIPLVNIHDNIFSLELFHGPTLAFKDVGARFLARCLSQFSNSERQITVLVATSGDTGSAVAQGFLDVPNVKVVILYPKNKVSPLQEKQLTTIGKNIKALEVDGTFDDCQQMVKNAFLDEDLNESINLTSANSINIARLVPQSIYYFGSMAQIDNWDNVVFSVPSGNYGNLTAGLLAVKMGLPIHKFVATSNRNDIVPKYLENGNFEPKPSVQTISNAMDVGNPSNFGRMMELFDNSLEAITIQVEGNSFDDEATKETIKDVYQKHNYMLDPHGAVGYLGLSKAMENRKGTGIVLETAHPAKFIEVMEEINVVPEMPERLANYLNKKKSATQMSAEFGALKKYLLNK